LREITTNGISEYYRILNSLVRISFPWYLWVIFLFGLFCVILLIVGIIILILRKLKIIKPGIKGKKLEDDSETTLTLEQLREKRIQENE